MLKLLIHSSPLKELIFYDCPDYEKNDSETDPAWLEDELLQLFQMGARNDEVYARQDNTEYLFLIGNRFEEQCVPHWQACIVKKDEFDSVIDSLQ